VIEEAEAAAPYSAGMIEQLEGMPPGTLGFRAAGAIKREDYAGVLVPALRAAVESGGPLRMLYVIEDMTGIEPSALWSDAQLGFDLGVRHHDLWERSAIVTDVDWIANATRLFAWMMPGEARVFPLAELAAAKAWVAGEPG
jgi:hypothetical protein